MKGNFKNHNMLTNSIFKLITMFIKTHTFLLTNKAFRTKLDHIKYEVL
jgi:hypothetical protein